MAQAGNGGSAGSAGTNGLVEFPIPTSGGLPWDITTGPDGNLWFTEQTGNKIGRITPAGVITEFTIPDANALPVGIAAGSDGRLWFTEAGSGFVGAVTTAGVFSKYPYPSYPATMTSASGITAGPDGALWFTFSVTSSPPNPSGPRLGRMSTTGVATDFPVPTGAFPLPVGQSSRITSGPGGKLWFTVTSIAADNFIGFASVSGDVMSYAIPAMPRLSASGAITCGIAAGPDGNLWFAEQNSNFAAIVRMTPSGTMTGIVPGSTMRNPCGVAAGPDGNVWFTESNAIGRVTP